MFYNNAEARNALRAPLYLRHVESCVEYGRVGFLATSADRCYDKVEVVKQTMCQQRPLESLVKVGHDAELDAAVTQRL